MQPQVQIPGVGTVTVLHRFWSGPEVRVDGVAVKRTGRSYALIGEDGGSVPATIEGVFFEAYPTIVANGQRYRTGPETSVWLKAIAVLPLGVLLVFLGGAIPILIGVGGLAVNLAILRSERSTNAKLGLMLAVLAASFLVPFGILAAVSMLV